MSFRALSFSVFSWARGKGGEVQRPQPDRLVCGEAWRDRAADPGRRRPAARGAGRRGGAEGGGGGERGGGALSSDLEKAWLRDGRLGGPLRVTTVQVRGCGGGRHRIRPEE